MSDTDVGREYRVSWSVEVPATSPLAAATAALCMQRDTCSHATVFEVTEFGVPGAATVTLDLRAPRPCRHCGGPLVLDVDTACWDHAAGHRVLCPDGAGTAEPRHTHGDPEKEH